MFLRIGWHARESRWSCDRLRIEIASSKFLITILPTHLLLSEVSSGSYIRSIAHDLGQLAGCGAHLASLCRVQAGEFTLQHAMTLEEIAAWSA